MMKIVKYSILINTLFHVNNLLIIYLSYFAYVKGFTIVWALLSPFLFLTFTTILLATDVRPEYKIFKKLSIIGLIVRIVTVLSVLIVIGNLSNKSILYYDLSIFTLLVILDFLISFKIYRRSVQFIDKTDYKEKRLLTNENIIKIYSLAQDKSRMQITKDMVKCDLLMGFSLGFMYLISRSELNTLLRIALIITSILLYLITIKINYRIIIYVYGELNKKRFTVNFISGVLALIFTFILAKSNTDRYSLGTILSGLICLPIFRTNRMVAVKNVNDIENHE